MELPDTDVWTVSSKKKKKKGGKKKELTEEGYIYIIGDSNEIRARNERVTNNRVFRIIKMLKHVGKFHYLPSPPPSNINSEAYIKIALAAEMALRSSHNSYSTRATRTCKMARSSRLRAPSPPYAVVRENFFSLLGPPPWLIPWFENLYPPRPKRSSSPLDDGFHFMHLFLSRSSLSSYGDAIRKQTDE